MAGNTNISSRCNSMESVTHAELLQHLGVGLRGGFILPFTYILGAHVLNYMSARGVRQSVIALKDIAGSSLIAADQKTLIAGAIEWSIHTGEGVRLSRGEVSLKYVNALQQLHWFCGIHNDIQESRLDSPDFADYHFTGLTNVNPGVHWTERTPITYRLTDCSEDDARGMLAQALGDENGKSPAVIASVLYAR